MFINVYKNTPQIDVHLLHVEIRCKFEFAKNRFGEDTEEIVDLKVINTFGFKRTLFGEFSIDRWCREKPLNIQSELDVSRC